MNFLKENQKKLREDKIKLTKKLILILGIVVLFVPNLNATKAIATKTNSIHCVTIAKDNIIKIYSWSVKTQSGKSAGTSHSLEDAKQMVALFSRNDIVLEKQITSYYVLKSDVNKAENMRYYWEVESTHGNAKGFSSSKKDAKAIIALVASGDIVTYKIITSKKSK